MTTPRRLFLLCACAAMLCPSRAPAGPSDPLNEVTGTEDWDKEDQVKKAAAAKKDDFKEQVKDWEVTKKRISADKDELKQERIIFQSVSGGAAGAPAGFYPVPAKQDDWMQSEADALEGRYRKGQTAAPAAPAKPVPGRVEAPAAPPPPPKSQSAWPDDTPIVAPAQPSTIQVIKSPPRQPPAALPVAAPVRPPPPPPPPPKKEETAEDILKKQKGHFDDSSGQFVDDELSEVSGKKKK